jgi:PAS domain S-box-containing protein
MAEQKRTISGSSLEDWVIRQLPGITYLCSNDELYTMRFVCEGFGSTIGYDLQDFIDNKHYFAASVIHPDDVDLVDELAEIAAARRGKVMARYRIVNAKGEPIPFLFTVRAIRDKQGEARWFCGFTVDIRDIPELQGPSAILTDLDGPAVAGQAEIDDLPNPISASWVLNQLGVAVFASSDEPNYTPVYVNERSHWESGYVQESLTENSKICVSSLVPPESQDITDECIEMAAAKEDRRVVFRIALVRSDGTETQSLCFDRGVRSDMFKEGRGVAGVAIYLDDVPPLQGPPKIIYADDA